MKIITPDLGVDSAEVSEIMVKVGDVLAKDDNIVLLESDKASVEVPTTAAGKVTAILINLGDKVSEGTALIEIEATDSAEASPAPSQEAPTEPAPTDTKPAPSEVSALTNAQASSTQSGGEQTFALPDLGVDEAQVSEIMVSVGDQVEAEQSILLVESDKASVEVPAPTAGKVVKLLVQAGDTVTNGQNFIVIETVGVAQNAPTQSTANTDKPAQTAQAAPAPSTKPQEPKQSAPISTNPEKLSEDQVNAKLIDAYAGPAVRKLARQLGVDITLVKGSAPNNRILKEDLFSYVKARLNNTPTAQVGNNTTGLSAGLPPLPDMSKADIWGEIEYQDLSRLQKVSIPQLNYNTHLPQVTQFDLSDITDTEKLRNELKGEFKAQGIGLTILAFIVKATGYALTQFPKFNSHLSDDNTQILIRKSVNMGIAVATDDGLIVPVIRDVQNKGIKQIAIEIGELAKKARDKKLSAKELQGASFTISSQGNLGGTAFTPLVNWPQVGILGVSEASMQPRWNASKQSFEPRLMLPLSLSYDHRVINGADAAVFTRFIANLLADPRKILL